jgi:hypothetical protein
MEDGESPNESPADNRKPRMIRKQSMVPMMMCGNSESAGDEHEDFGKPKVVHAHK